LSVAIDNSLDKMNKFLTFRQDPVAMIDFANSVPHYAGVLFLMFAMLIWNKLPTWLIFMATLAVCMTLQLAPEGDLLKGIANWRGNCCRPFSCGSGDVCNRRLNNPLPAANRAP
jgi:hypothetical protein